MDEEANKTDKAADRIELALHLNTKRQFFHKSYITDVMNVYALTGGIATGKSTAAGIFKELKVPVLCSDSIVHSFYEPNSLGALKIAEAFGEDYLLETGEVNRSKLFSEVFPDPEQRFQLESVIHPLVRSELIRRSWVLFLKGHRHVIWDIPLFYEAGVSTNWSIDFAKVYCVACDEETQVQRLLDRSNKELSQVKEFLNAQLPLSFKVANSEVIDNSGDLDALKTAVLDRVSRDFVLKLKPRLLLYLLFLLFILGVIFIVRHIKN
ncbi:hypothetical protein PCE1_003339 [Barthelona sp. PCE]